MNATKHDMLNGVLHDHCHFGRMFNDLKETFRSVATQDVSLHDHPEVLDTALEDLSYLIQEMIAHFEVEENALSTVVAKYPEFESKIDEFQKSHDRISSEFCQLEKKLKSGDSEEVSGSALKIYEMISALNHVVDEHARDENELLRSVFEAMDEEDCETLKRALRALS